MNFIFWIIITAILLVIIAILFVKYIRLSKKREDMKRKRTNLTYRESNMGLGVVQFEAYLYLPTKQDYWKYDDLIDYIRKNFTHKLKFIYDFVLPSEELTNFELPEKGVSDLINVKKALKLDYIEYQEIFNKELKE